MVHFPHKTKQCSSGATPKWLASLRSVPLSGELDLTFGNACAKAGKGGVVTKGIPCHFPLLESLFGKSLCEGSW